MTKNTKMDIVLPKMACWNTANCGGWPNCRLAHTDPNKNKPVSKYNTRGSVAGANHDTKTPEKLAKKKQQDSDDNESEDEVEEHLTPISTRKLKPSRRTIERQEIEEEKPTEETNLCTAKEETKEENEDKDEVNISDLDNNQEFEREMIRENIREKLEIEKEEQEKIIKATRGPNKQVESWRNT